MQFSILIPTYNRRTYLENNCSSLIGFIEKLNLHKKVQLCISNNASTDDTYDYLEGLKSSPSLNVDLIIYHQESNIGSVNNVLFLLHNSNAETVIFLGDDDFIEEKYLEKVVKQVETNQNLSCIVPSNSGILEDGTPLGFNRDVNLPSKLYDAGFTSCLENAWRGHQMSGLVFNRKLASDAIKEKHINNLYLFIFIVGNACLNGQLLHMTDHPVLVTRPPQHKKQFNYGDDGLISEIFVNFKCLDGLTGTQRTKLELKILDEQYWRYMMYIKKGVMPFIKAIYNIVSGKNTSALCSFLFPILMPYFLAKRVILLATSGELVKTLNRTVDI